MIWLGYAGLSGAIVFSMGLLTWIMGLPSEAVLRLVAQSAAVLLAFGLGVHLCAIALRRHRRKQAAHRLPPVPPFLQQPAVQAAAKRPDQPPPKPLKPVPRKPGPTGSLAVLWPKHPAHQ